MQIPLLNHLSDGHPKSNRPDGPGADERNGDAPIVCLRLLGLSAPSSAGPRSGAETAALAGLLSARGFAGQRVVTCHRCREVRLDPIDDRVDDEAGVVPHRYVPDARQDPEPRVRDLA
jgi:hypothetical protein